MLTLRKAADRGPTNLGWLDSRHTFSFGGYRDPAHMGFRDLLVINEDRVAPGRGFGRHGHADMEILSYVIEGELGHRDSTGTDGVIRPGELQRMSAGTGIEHSEMNASATDPVHFLQIWIKPETRGIAPGYEQMTLPPVEANAALDLIASPEGGASAVKLHADARVWRISLRGRASITHPLAPGRHGWVQAVRGDAVVAGVALTAGDGLAVRDQRDLVFAGGSAPAELLLFDLA